MKRQLATVLSALIILALVAGPANAHVVYQRYDVWVTTEKCTRAYAGVSHGSEGMGFADTSTEARQLLSTPWGDQPCGYWETKPPGWIRNKMDLFVWDRVYNEWGLCGWTDWYHNTRSARSAGWKGDMPAPPCGPGHYGVVSYAGVYHNNGWYGGLLWSGSHELPQPGGAEAEEQPSQPSWVDANLVVPESAMVSVPLAGPDGRIVRDPTGAPVMVTRHHGSTVPALHAASDVQDATWTVESVAGPIPGVPLDQLGILKPYELT